MSYMEAFVAAVPDENRDKYIEHTREMSAIFKEYGVLSQMEGWGMDVPDGEVTSFPMAVQKKDDETVVVGWMVWPSKEQRDAGWEKIMADPRMAQFSEMPFDGKRMIFGGFEPILEV